MSDHVEQHKQILLMERIFLALKKVQAELEEYELSEQSSDQPPSLDTSASASLSNAHLKKSANEQQATPQRAETLDLETLKVALQEKLTFLEQRFHIALNNQASLVKRALFVLERMQAQVERYKQLRSSLQKLSPSPSGIQPTAHAGEEKISETSQPDDSVHHIPALSPTEREQDIPLSFTQQRLWFLEQLDPGKPLYNEFAALRLKGALNIDALEQSFSEIMRRHSVLRTTFASSVGEAVQRIHPWRPVKIEPMDLQSLPLAEREAQVISLAEAEIEKPLDLIHGPLFKIQLFQLAEDDHLLLTIFHHLIGDGWSMGLLYHELTMIYEAFCVGETSPLAVLPIQYADFAVWQQQWFRDTLREKQLTFWKKQLSGAPTVLELPTDHPRPIVPSRRGASYSFMLPAPLTTAIRELSQSEGVTLFMTLLGAFQLLLYRYSGQEDLLIGTPIANRNRAEIEPLVGFFANTLVLRGNLAGNPTFRELLQRVKNVALESYKYQDAPFEQLVAAIQPVRDLSYSPLFQVMFVLQHSTWFDIKMSGLEVILPEIKRKRATFDLVLAVIEDGSTLRCSLEYNTDLFEAETLVRFAEHWRVILEQVTTHPEQRVTAVPILTPQEQTQLLIEWNGNKQTYPQGRCIHELVAEQAAHMPDAIAVAYQDQQLSYEQLNLRANQLASYLRSCGVGPDVLVGICVERSLEMVISILGVLKAGGAYVPLDPAYPKDRLTFILEDAAISVVITQSTFVREQYASQVKVVCLDTDWTAIARMSSANPLSHACSTNLAYVIYTSGSTGRPKGVVVEHASLCNLIEALIPIYKIQPLSHVLQFVSFNFDVSVSDIFMTLRAGARLCLPPLEEMAPGEPLLNVLQEQAITMIRVPVAVLSALPLASLPALEIVCTGGESLTSDVVAKWKTYGSMRFFNEYGPTETTVTATNTECVPTNSRIIGRPLANVELYILDRTFTPVPVGIPGELYIGGAGLARGYLYRAEITAERFVPNLFGTQPGTRLYKTGDLVRYLPDGSLEFLGRTDNQVKIRGFRIELDEIEATLAQHPAVQENAVIAREDTPGDKRLVAYIVAGEQSAVPSAHELRSFCQEKLPDFMVPSVFVSLEALPLTPNGKIDRRALPPPQHSRADLTGENLAPQTEKERTIAAAWREILHIEQIGVRDNFFDLGGHSLSMVKVHNKLKETVKADLALVDLFKYPTIESLAHFLGAGQEGIQSEQQLGGTDAATSTSRQRSISAASSDIAIIGMAGRFPQARDLDEFWQNLQDGVESVSFFSQEELLAANVPQHLLENPRYVGAGAILDEIEYFDASFFGYSPREAESIDPQQRLFLEGSWQALENAGYDPETYPGSIGVYAGLSMNTYLTENLRNNRTMMDNVGLYQLVVGNGNDFLTTRVSYKLNLRGPSVTVQTACSTSLVAIHIACESLRYGTCDMALAGGVSVRVPQKTGYLYEEGSILSPDGHCRAFDVESKGIVGGEGLGVVLLKRLVDAQADGDSIFAVIKGSAINNDGAVKVGYTAPSVQGQARAIADALAMANIAPQTVSYIEAHGTGTPIGDPIEIAALREVYGTSRDSGLCGLGSIKTNIGHLDAAAGVAGLLKTVLALQHQALPPSLHFETPNPALDLSNSPFYVNTTLRPWEPNGTLRRAGVSSFGIGGTNAHVVLEEAPPLEPATTPSLRPYQLLLLSAKTASALDQARINLIEHLQHHSEQNLADVSYTLQVGRQPFNYRLAVVCADHNDAIQALSTPDSLRFIHATAESGNRPVAFLFPGQGAQYVDMGQELYQVEPIFRATIDQCAELLLPLLNLDLRTILYPTEEYAAQLDQTEFTQPALFVIEYALAKLWMHWGIHPQAMIGHSIGEYVAACLAGVFSLEDALALVVARGRLMQELPAGAMLTISLPEKDVQTFLNPALSIAAHNSMTSCVVSGPIEAIQQLEQRLTSRKVPCRRLHTSHAFHSQMMEPILERFLEQVQAITLQPPKLLYLSNLTGTWITPQEATNPSYWVKHLRHCVRFAEGMEELCKNSQMILLEVGPGRTLTTLAKRHPARKPDQLIVSSLRHPQDQTSDRAFLLTTCGYLWCAGLTIKWASFYADERRQRLPLPTYPFERRRYWVSPDKDLSTEKMQDQGTRFSLPTWKRFPLSKSGTDKKHSRRWLICTDNLGLGSQIIRHLEQEGEDVVVVRIGEELRKMRSRVYTLSPYQLDDYHTLIQELRSQNWLPTHLVHLWTVVSPKITLSSVSSAASQAHGITSLLSLLRELHGYYDDYPLQTTVISNNLQDVIGGEIFAPERAGILGPATLVPSMYPHIMCRSIDVVVPSSKARQKQLVEHLLIDIKGNIGHAAVAYRGAFRWAQTIDPAPSSGESLEDTVPLQERGVYLLTGGLTGLGFRLARYLAVAVQARLVLVEQPGFPPREGWGKWSSTHGAEDETAHKIDRIHLLEELGATVLVLSANCSDLEQMQAILAQTFHHFAGVHGIIHIVDPLKSEIQGMASDIVTTELTSLMRTALVLATILQDTRPDFLVLCSSGEAGELGLADYGASNAFLKSFAAFTAASTGIKTMSVIWDAWLDSDQHSDYYKDGETLQWLLSFEGVSQVIVSTRGNQATNTLLSLTSSEHDETNHLYSRPELQTSYVGPRNILEQCIVDIWQKLLGIAKIGIHDNFFALGGDSLLATQIVSRLREEFQIEIPLRTLFEDPTVAGLAQRLEQMQSRKAEIQASPIMPVMRTQEQPLSFAQQRLWFLDQLEPGSITYNIPGALRLRGNLDLTTLERSFQVIVQRHESLRTTFHAIDGRPVQVIGRSAPLMLPVVDLSILPPAQREEYAQLLSEQHAQSPFNLTQGPLFYTTLMRLGVDDHILLLTIHHIISDGWSMEIFIRELALLYNAFTKGELSALPALPVQYADFAVWQREWLQGEVLAKQKHFWMQCLAGLSPLDIPTDHPRPAVQTFHGTYQTQTLPAGLSQRLRDLSQREGITLFMVLLAAFQVLLSRYSGQTDIAVGSPIANRTHAEIENLIGFFVNTLVLRTDLSGNPGFTRLLERVRDVTLSAYAHQELPFEQVVDAVQPERDLSRSPLFQVMFVLQNAPRASEDLEGVTFHRLEVASPTAKFDLTLFVIEAEEGLRCAIEYNTDLFEANTITRLLGHWQTLLEGVVARPEQPISELPLLTASEQRQLLVEPRMPYPSTLCLPTLFNEQVERTPDAVALVYEEEYLTYAELNKRANQLAYYLQTFGVGPDVLVPICIERTPGLIVGLLAILKAGGAYVPLDPAYPQERLALMLEGVQASVLLTQAHLVGCFPEYSKTLVCIDSDWEQIAQQPAQTPESRVTPDNLVYVIYTSGSTGKPKGAGVYHRGFVNLLYWFISEFSISFRDRDLLITSASFDLTQKNLFAPLLVGGSVHFLTPGHFDAYPITQAIQQQSITLLNCTPSAFYPLVEALHEDEWSALSSLRYVFLGGEPIAVSRLADWLRSAHSQAEVVNTYGPTECSDVVSFHRLNPSAGSLVPIGKAVSNTMLLILDTYLQVVPVGVVGELYIAGDCVGTGYINDRELTATKFIPHPYSTNPGARLYRTGDLTRYLEDGSIEFVGRVDHQIKLRGFRIELGEIEAMLSQHPAISENLVMIRQDEKGEHRLVAYVVLNCEEGASTADLRQYLLEKLPDYMVPAFFVGLEHFPTTPSGKVDRQALPAPVWHSTVDAEQEPVTSNPIMEIMINIYAETLGSARVGIHDNFFDVGGHSLLATQLISRIRKILHVELPLRTLFEHPTVADLTSQVELAQRGQQGISLPPLTVASREQDLPLSFAQQRLWFLHQLEPDSVTYNIPVAVRLGNMLECRVLEQSFAELVRRHESLRTIFTEQEGQPRQIIADTLSFILPIVDLSALHPVHRREQAQLLTEQQAQHLFDLSRSPLFCVILLRLESDDHILLLTIHHIISDGWSMDILVRDLALLYNALAKGEPSPLPALPIQYADFAVWQREWLQGEVLENQLRFWSQSLAGVSPLELPTDHPRPAIQTFHGTYQTQTLPIELSRQLQALCQRRGVTLFMTLLAAFQVLLSRYSGQTDIAVGTPIANRTHAEIEDLIGFFVNTLVMRTDLSGNPSFIQLLERVREVTLGAYAHQDIPFEQLVDAVQPERDLSRSPLFQVMFVLQNASRSTLELEGVTFDPIDSSSSTAKFDLTLLVIETQEGLRCVVEYNTDLFEADTITRLLGHWQTLLEGIVAAPQTSLAQLPFLSQAEQIQVLEQWNQTERSYPLDVHFAQLFSRQVAHTPTAIAAVSADTTLTYEQLYQRAGLLAMQLRQFGVGPERLVGLYLPRSLDLLVAILGTFLAGGAYVPLDPNYPQQRIDYILRDAQVQVILTLPQLRTQLPDSLPAAILPFDLSTQVVPATIDLEGLPTDEQDSLACQQLAYMIYTSGSTGLPKGAMLTQHGMLNHLYAKIETLQIDVQDCIAQTASPSFDISVWQFLVALLRGAQVHVLPEEVVRDPYALLQHVQQAHIHILEVVPTMLQAMIDVVEQAGDQTDWSLSLRWLVVTGEALPAEVSRRWLQRFPHIPLVNAYGPTECSDDVSQAVLNELPSGPLGSMPIGHALPNTRLYVLDAWMQPLPIGVLGEIYVGGDGVGRGYWQQASKTAEVFVPDLFSRRPGSRLYKTGDLGRYHRDGRLEFVRRIDEQVKIRGYRIELGEIEGVLATHPAVNSALVQVQRDAQRQEPHLIAYVVSHPEVAMQETELRSFLKQKLPDYMVPPFFVMLPAWPLTPNGKIDRQALPAPSRSNERETDSQMQAPRGELEELLTQIWRQVLDREKIGLHESFFEVGGHSLLATQVIARVRTAFRVEIPLRAIFEAPTIAGLARLVEQGLRQEQAGGLAPLAPVSREQTLPLSFAQQRLWFLYQMNPDTTAYNIFGTVRLEGALDTVALWKSLTEIVRRHENLRTVFQVQNDQPVQVITPVEIFLLRRVDLRALDQRKPEVQNMINWEATLPFDLTHGPLLRVTLVQEDEEQYLLLLTMHHIISDGWSIGVFIHELTTLYAAFHNGQPSPLAELPIQYADYALWQRQWLQGEVLKEQVRYWTKQLSEAQALELPTDYPRTNNQTYQGAGHTFRLPAELTQSIHSLSRREGVTLFMTLLAAFQILLYRISDQEDIVVGTDSANRSRVETESLIGFFVNLLVLRSNINGKQSFRDILRQVREMVLGAYTHQELPFEMVVEHLRLERQGNQTPLVNVLFVQQNIPSTHAELPGLHIYPLDSEITASKFDLALFISEESEDIQGTVHYRTDLFKASTIETMMRHLEVLLHSIVGQPDTIVDGLEMYTEAEKQQKETKKETRKKSRLNKLKDYKENMVDLS